MDNPAPPQPPQPDTNPERKKTLNIYTLFGVTLLSGLIPHWIGAVAALVLLTFLLSWAYSAKGGFEKDGFGENHMSFIIRTIWIGSFFGILTITAGTIYMMLYIDHTPLMPCVDNIMNMALSVTNIWNISGLEAKVMAALDVCMDDYIQTNLKTLVISTVISIGPILAYFGVRFVRGLSHAIRGNVVENVRGWF